MSVGKYVARQETKILFNRLQEKMKHERKQKIYSAFGRTIINGHSLRYCGRLHSQAYMSSDWKATWGEEESEMGQFGGYIGPKHTFLASWMVWNLDIMPRLGCLVLRTIFLWWWAFIHTLCQILMITLWDSYPILPRGRLPFNTVS